MCPRAGSPRHLLSWFVTSRAESEAKVYNSIVMEEMEVEEKSEGGSRLPNAKEPCVSSADIDTSPCISAASRHLICICTPILFLLSTTTTTTIVTRSYHNFYNVPQSFHLSYTSRTRRIPPTNTGQRTPGTHQSRKAPTPRPGITRQSRPRKTSQKTFQKEQDQWPKPRQNTSRKEPHSKRQAEEEAARTSSSSQTTAAFEAAMLRLDDP